MKVRTLVIIVSIFLIIIILLLSGCGNKSECEVNRDCSVSNKCFIGKCFDGKCSTIKQPDCCGNHVCEADAGENKCTCEKDCGDCSGAIKYNYTNIRGRTTVKETVYAVNICRDDVCVIGANKNSQNELSLASEIDQRGSFKAELLTTINQPFDIAVDDIILRMTLINKDSNVVGNININRIQILSGNQVMKEKIVSEELSELYDSFTISFENLKTGQEAIEEEQDITVKIDFIYVKLVRNEEQLISDSISKKLSEDIMIIK